MANYNPTVLNLNTPNNIRSNNSDRPKAQVYLNVGIPLDDDTFISLPLGIALDTMSPAKTDTNSPEMNKANEERNILLDKLNDKLSTLKPGETFYLDTMKITAYRTKDIENNDPKDMEEMTKKIAKIL